MLDSNNDSHDDVEVKDSGSGITSEIFPNIYSKFVSNLDIDLSRNVCSKNIIKLIEVISAQNQDNNDEKAATFSFGLPSNKWLHACHPMCISLL